VSQIAFAAMVLVGTVPIAVTVAPTVVVMPCRQWEGENEWCMSGWIYASEEDYYAVNRRLRKFLGDIFLVEPHVPFIPELEIEFRALPSKAVYYKWTAKINSKKVMPWAHPKRFLP
jgi:hypothetical protein